MSFKPKEVKIGQRWLWINHCIIEAEKDNTTSLVGFCVQIVDPMRCRHLPSKTFDHNNLWSFCVINNIDFVYLEGQDSPNE